MTTVDTLDGAVLREAAQDMRHLLGRGYPRARVLELVGDRHALDASARRVLRRGVHPPLLARARRDKLIPASALIGTATALDGHNQIIALEAALKGLPLVLGDDGVVRDIQGLGPRHRPDAITWRAARLLCAALKEREAASALFLLDAPLGKSGELAAHLRGIMAEMGLAGEARAVAVPERELILHAGPVASSDGALLDAVARPVDLAGQIIMELEPRPWIIELGADRPQPNLDPGDAHHA
jgi:hypothetical protein